MIYSHSQIQFPVVPLLSGICLMIVLASTALSQNFALDKSFIAGVDERSFILGAGQPQSVATVSAFLPDGKILVGGRFTSVNGEQAYRYLTRLNPDGSTDPDFNVGGAGPNSSVYDIVILSNGKILVGGGFSQYNGVLKRGVVQLNSDGSLDTTFNTGAEGALGNIQTIVTQPDGKILISGDALRSYNGITVNSVARLNADGSLDSTFAPPFSTPLYAEEVNLAPDGKIYVSCLSASSPGVTRLNGDGSVDTTFVSAVPDGQIYAMLLQADGKVLIGGAFRNVNGIPRETVARLNADGSLDSSFVPPVYPPADQDYAYTDDVILQSDGRVLLAGMYGYRTGFRRPLIRLNADGSKDDSFVVQADDGGYSVNIQSDGRIICTGFFSRFMPDGSGHSEIVRLDPNGNIDATFNASLSLPGGIVNETVVQPDGKILVAGQFLKANGQTAPEIARFNSDGTLDTSFSLEMGPLYERPWIGITAMALQPDGKILVGGSFEGFNNYFRNALVRLNPDGSLDSSFTFPIGVLVVPYAGAAAGNGVADIVVLPDGKILAAGSFQTGGSRMLIRLNNDGSLDTSFINGHGTIVPEASGHRIVVQPDQKIIVAGYLRTVSPNSTRCVVRFNMDGSRDTSFSAPAFLANLPAGDVVLQPDGKMIVLGAPFPYASGRVVRLNVDGTLDSTFNPGSGPDWGIYASAVQPDGKILIGGSFTQYNGVPRNGLARINVDGSLDMSFNSAFAGGLSHVNSLRFQPDGKLLVGGLFSEYAGTMRKSFLRLTPAGSASTGFDYDGDSKADLSVYRPSNGLWFLDRSRDGGFVLQLGNESDKITPADYDGDGKTDLAVYRPSQGVWYQYNSVSSTYVTTQFGLPEDIPAPGDYDGDGRADLAVFRPSNGIWYIQQTTDGLKIEQFGATGDVPAPGDFDGDGKNDLAVWRPSNGVWYQRRSTGSDFAVQFGASGDKISPADYDGDGKTDVGVYRPSQGIWYRINSSNGGYPVQLFGLAGDIPVAADYDGDGRADIGVFRPSDRTWYIDRTTSGLLITQYGLGGDTPTPSAFAN